MYLGFKSQNTSAGMPNRIAAGIQTVSIRLEKVTRPLPVTSVPSSQTISSSSSSPARPDAGAV